MLPKIVSLVSIALLLAWMLYFTAGCLPLLVLKHDDDSDSRLVRGMFDVHYLVLMSIAAIGALNSAVSGRPVLAAASACIAIYAFMARRLIVPRMDQLRATMVAANARTIQSFRKLHMTGLALNVVLLAGLLSTLGYASAEIISCTQQPPGCQGDACRVLCSLVQ